MIWKFQTFEYYRKKDKYASFKNLQSKDFVGASRFHIWLTAAKTRKTRRVVSSTGRVIFENRCKIWTFFVGSRRCSFQPSWTIYRRQSIYFGPTICLPLPSNCLAAKRQFNSLTIYLFHRIQFVHRHMAREKTLNISHIISVLYNKGWFSLGISTSISISTSTSKS